MGGGGGGEIYGPSTSSTARKQDLIRTTISSELYLRYTLKQHQDIICLLYNTAVPLHITFNQRISKHHRIIKARNNYIL